MPDYRERRYLLSSAIQDSFPNANIVILQSKKALFHKDIHYLKSYFYFQRNSANPGQSFTNILHSHLADSSLKKLHINDIIVEGTEFYKLQNTLSATQDNVVILLSDQSSFLKETEGKLIKYLTGNPESSIHLFTYVNPEKVKSFDGKSFLPILNGEKDKIHESLYFEMGFSRGVLKDSCKYIALRYPEFAMNWDYNKRKEVLDKWNNFRIKNKLKYHFTDPNLPFSHLMLVPGGGDAEYPSTQRYKHYYDTDQFYDLRTDPTEQDNLFNDPKYQDKVHELQDVLKGYLNELPGTFGEFKTK